MKCDIAYRVVREYTKRRKTRWKQCKKVLNAALWIVDLPESDKCKAAECLKLDMLNALSSIGFQFIVSDGHILNVDVNLGIRAA